MPRDRRLRHDPACDLEAFDELSRIVFVAEQPVQTNEVQRCWALLPCVLEAAERLDASTVDLIELGTSAGLLLFWDRYRYRYESGEWGPAAARLELAGEERGRVPARLLSRGTAKVAQKLGEEAVECVIEATQGHRAATVLESADLLYHLVVVWVDAGIRPAEVWAELARRQGISGIAEKASRPQGIMRAAGTTKLP